MFIEKGLHLLNKQGYLNYILPHKFFNAKYGGPIREVIAGGKHLSKIVHFGDEQIFEEATTYVCLLFLDRSPNEAFEFHSVEDISAWSHSHDAANGSISTEKVDKAEWNFVIGPEAEIYQQLFEMPVKLGDIASIFVGLQTSADTVFLLKDANESETKHTLVHSKELNEQVELETDLLKPVIRSGNIDRYWAENTALVLFPYKFQEGNAQLLSEGELQSKYPLTWAYLSKNKDLLENREGGKFKDSGWYQLYPKNLDLWEQHKLMLPYMITRLAAFYDDKNQYFVNVTTGGFGITLNDQQCSPKYLTGLLNSTLLDWFLKIVSTNFNSGYFAANKQFLAQLPIRTLNLSNPNRKRAA